VQITQKAAGMLVPGLGAAAGVAVNLLFMDHFQSVSRGHFIMRRLERRYGPKRVQDAYRRIGSNLQ
ncbi:MAG: EcsC family protein, partial [Gammaproteobacteria bacterium]